MTSFDDLYRSEYGRLVSFAQQFAPTRVGEDVANESFLALWQVLETGNVESPKGLLYRIAEGLARNAYRKAQREEPRDHRVEPGTPTRSAAPCFATDFDEVVRGLDDETRDAFILTELRGLTTREAAGVLDTSHMTIHRRAEDARRTVQKEIA